LFTFIDLFAGIGGIRIPFEELGGTCVFSSEWDKNARKTYFANFGEVTAGDITKISELDIPDHDILLAGFPCQSFSIMGKQLGFADTRGTLFFDIERILRAKRPSAFLLENVKQLTTHDKGRTLGVILSKLEQLGYHVHWKVLNALDFGLPQKRERIFIVGFLEDYDFSFPAPLGTTPSLDTVLEPDDTVESRYFASPEIQKKRRDKLSGEPFYPSIWHENKSGNVSVLPYSCALRAGASYNYLLVNGIRRPTERELLRLQGFPEDFKIVVSYTEIRRQLGNAVPVPVVREVAKKMLEAINQGVIRKTRHEELQDQLSLPFEDDANEKGGMKNALDGCERRTG